MDPMDIELDAQIELELADDPIVKALQSQSTQDTSPPEEAPEPAEPKLAEIDLDGLPRPNAIHVQGVDEMSTTDIKTYCNSTDLLKVEWINDSSCNLVFDNKEKANTVLTSLLLDPTSPVTHTTLVPAKPFENADGKTMTLQVRLATDEDVKSKGARERSRYYLLHGTEDSEVQAEGRSKAVAERMQRNGGDGRDVFSRLGNKVERRRERSASPVRETTRKTRELPDHLKSRLGFVKKEEEQVKTDDDKVENNE